jgi:hypothetical protein
MSCSSATPIKTALRRPTNSDVEAESGSHGPLWKGPFQQLTVACGRLASVGWEETVDAARKRGRGLTSKLLLHMMGALFPRCTSQRVLADLQPSCHARVISPSLRANEKLKYIHSNSAGTANRLAIHDGFSTTTSCCLVEYEPRKNYKLFYHNPTSQLVLYLHHLS